MNAVSMEAVPMEASMWNVLCGMFYVE